MHFSVFQGISDLVLFRQLFWVSFDVEKRCGTELQKTPSDWKQLRVYEISANTRKGKGSLFMLSQALGGQNLLCVSDSIWLAFQPTKMDEYNDVLNMIHGGINGKKNFVFLSSICILVSKECVQYLLDIHKGRQIVITGCKAQGLQATKPKT